MFAVSAVKFSSLIDDRLSVSLRQLTAIAWFGTSGYHHVMRLTVCIPARNEAAHIGDAVRRLARSLGDLDSPSSRVARPASQVGEAVDWRIIVAVNGSTDGTLDRVEELRITKYELRERVSALDCPKAGKGAALKCAAAQSSVVSGQSSVGEAQGYSLLATPYKLPPIFGFIDADLSADPDAIPGMVQKIIDDEADVVIASRLLQTKTTNRGWLRNVTSTLFNLFAHALLGIRVKDAQCGLKVMNEKAVNILKNCQEDGWFLDIEFLSLASRQGLRIIEVPVPWTEFRYPDRKSQIRHVRDGWGALVAMIRIRRRLLYGVRSTEYDGVVVK